jgi:hypothetical protein
MKRIERTYILYYLDKDGNELCKEQFSCIKPFGIKLVREYARERLANSMINDLKKIKVKKQFEIKL